MDLDTRLQNVTVIGAGGKMGSGIATLVLTEMMRLSLMPEHKDKKFRLSLVDVSDELLEGLRGYLRDQLMKNAEKSCIALRACYADKPNIIENYDVIDHYVESAMKIVRTGSFFEMAKDSHLVFEAIVENEKIKIKVFKQLKKLCGPETFFFTNTSSIPIKTLDVGAGLDGRIIGFHFYNPPVVQKLAELISSDKTRPDLVEISKEIAKRLRKTIVPSNDVAGFIGNGYFMRDGLFAIDKVKELKKELGYAGAVYALDKAGRDFLIRPMGIFQLIDYVGIDVFQLILKVMNGYLPGEGLHSDLIDKMMKLGVKGGQRPDGSQKDGFLKYEKGRPVAIFDPSKKEYIPYNMEGWTGKVEKYLGPPPAGNMPWKALTADRRKDDKLRPYFEALRKADTKGAQLARAYLARFREIGEKLIKMEIAASPDDVNNVITLGFYHLYGPISPYTEVK